MDHYSITLRSVVRLMSILCVLFLLVAPSGCSQPRKGSYPCQDKIVFEHVLQSDCAPPCWRDITPGLTDRNQVFALLDHESETIGASISAVAWGQRCAQDLASPQVEIQIDPTSEIVDSIMLAETERDCTFGDVVGEYGLPNNVMMNMVGPESSEGCVYLVYPEKGVAFVSGNIIVLGRAWQRPSADQKVYQWIYFAPTEPGRLLIKEGLIRGCGFQDDSFISDWSGFGD
jgi:hypothetical protein